MPVDVDSLTALGELASDRGASAQAHGSDQETVALAAPRRTPSPRRGQRPLPGREAAAGFLAAVGSLSVRTQLGALGAGSVAAGLLVGLAVPVAAATPSAPSTETAVTVLALPARTPAAATPGPTRSRAAARTTPAAHTTEQAAATSAGTGRAAQPSATSAAAATGMPTAGTLAVAAALPAAAARIDWTPARTSVAAARPAVTTAGPAELPPTRPSAATVADARAYKPTKKLPADSGTGRRIVYSQHRGHLWIVGSDGRVVRDYPVTGRIGRPAPGSYRVFSKSRTAVNPVAKVRFDLMVRFAHGITGAAIGFHTIPRWYDGRPLQRVSQLGQMIGAGGCVRQSTADARWLYAWSRIGERVVVLA